MSECKLQIDRYVYIKLPGSLKKICLVSHTRMNKEKKRNENDFEKTNAKKIGYQTI